MGELGEMGGMLRAYSQANGVPEGANKTQSESAEGTGIGESPSRHEAI